MDKIWDRKSFEVGGHWLKKKRFQNNQKLNLMKKLQHLVKRV